MLVEGPLSSIASGNRKLPKVATAAQLLLSMQCGSPGASPHKVLYPHHTLFRRSLAHGSHVATSCSLFRLSSCPVRLENALRPSTLLKGRSIQLEDRAVRLHESFEAVFFDEQRSRDCGSSVRAHVEQGRRTIDERGRGGQRFAACTVALLAPQQSLIKR